MTLIKKVGIAGAAAGLTLLLAGPPASAITPPSVDPTAPPPNGAPGPVAAFEQRADCVSSALLPGTDTTAVTAGQRQLDLPAAWQFSRGDGQTVAVIDTGVRPGPRLPAVDAGGDYVGSTDGLTDCDGHGTLVAGVVAGQPAPEGQDGFTGVAPGARLLSLRTASATVAPRLGGDDPRATRVITDVTALSRAIVHAADLGARVITISVTTCVQADHNVDQSALGAALRYAAVEKDALIVAAAGDSGQTGSVGGGGEACESNPLTDLSRPQDPRNWGAVTSLSVPSWWHPYVLSVGSLAPSGQPSAFTMAGPWVGVAAPGEGVLSISNREDGGLANALPTNQGKLVPLTGTGYAAGYVAGVAALVRSRFPEMNAMQVAHRIVATAHNSARAPSGLVGAGTIDPVAALTWELAPPQDPAHPPVKVLSPPPAPQPEDPAPRIVALAGTALLAGLVAAVATGAAAAARRRKEDQL
ncbi:type VII secretion-associated serine protease mycosin [[Mycobacterium] zoologicum]|uniref:type VII secretion-associated serine protease mycosin n=1 Tax=[Mycobacterium] zoologicum TaxID=2872311 RepID=UPI001CDAAF2B|nr:type VII secretion-associated serine protease mycosin [Mycolicibacter sp. MYC101]MEB3065355.1 type VII secretion-associated serine protease mycosin [Mycolicibacter sp. MYC101]